MGRWPAAGAMAGEKEVALFLPEFRGTEGVQRFGVDGKIVDFTAVYTAEMSMIGRVAVETLFFRADIDRADQFCLQQDVQRIVDRCAGKHWIFFRKRGINDIRRGVGMVFQQIIIDGNALLCRPNAVRGQYRRQFLMIRHVHGVHGFQ